MLTYGGNHFTICTYIKSLLYTLNVYNVICQLYLNKMGKGKKLQFFFVIISPMNTSCDLPEVNINKPDLAQIIVRNHFLCCHWYELTGVQLVSALPHHTLCFGLLFVFFGHKNTKSAECQHIPLP